MQKLFVISVATENSEEFKRFEISLNIQEIEYKILGMNTKWQGGNMEMGPGGGQKINLLRSELMTWNKERLNKYTILFTDSYDVITLTNSTEILNKYNSICDNDTVLFSAEKNCWPLKQLDIFYPETDSEYKFLNSGGFIGNAERILNLLEKKIENCEDDQLYYTKIFLFDNKIDNSINKIKLDYGCEIFQTLNGAFDDIDIVNKKRIFNKYTNTFPCLLHGNGAREIKEYFNKLSESIIKYYSKF
jgi:hypothetical protein